MFGHAFVFHMPTKDKRFNGMWAEVASFAKMILFSALINSLVVYGLYYADKEAILDRTNWDRFRLSGDRSQSKADAGCEYAADDRTNYIAQPITALSNFTFSFSGFLILEFAFFDLQNWVIYRMKLKKKRRGSAAVAFAGIPNQLIASHPMLSFTLAGCLIMMAITSFQWHASLTNMGADYDFGTMYILIVYVITLCFLRGLFFIPFTRRIHFTIAIHVISAIGLTIGIIMFVKKTTIADEISDVTVDVLDKETSQNDLIIYMIIMIVCLIPIPFALGVIRMVKNAFQRIFDCAIDSDEEKGFFVGKIVCCSREKEKSRKEVRKEQFARRRRSWGLGLLALVNIVIAKEFRGGDMTYMCDEWWGPHHKIQAHAIWHTGCSFAILFCYLFLRSEVFNNSAGRGMCGGRCFKDAVDLEKFFNYERDTIESGEKEEGGDLEEAATNSLVDNGRGSEEGNGIEIEIELAPQESNATIIIARGDSQL